MSWLQKAIESDLNNIRERVAREAAEQKAEEERLREERRRRVEAAREARMKEEEESAESTTPAELPGETHASGTESDAGPSATTVTEGGKDGSATSSHATTDDASNGDAGKGDSTFEDDPQPSNCFDVKDAIQLMQSPSGRGHGKTADIDASTADGGEKEDTSDHEDSSSASPNTTIPNYLPSPVKA